MIGEDLETVLAAAGLRLASAEPITGLPATALGRATFRLTLANGSPRVLKGRRLDCVADADRIRSVVAKLGRPELPRVLAQHRTALLEEWIDGEPLGRAVPDEVFVERCGRILGAIHATPLDGTDDGHARHSAMDAYRCRAEWTFQALASEGVISSATADDIRALATRNAPASVSVGYVHGDFCAENIVICADGSPAIVDSGGVGIEAFDFDLARTWYRWPLRPAQQQAFDAGYRSLRPDDSFSAHFPFWALFVLADATLFRVRAGAARWRVPLRRLDRLLRDLRRRDGPSARPPAAALAKAERRRLRIMGPRSGRPSGRPTHFAYAGMRVSVSADATDLAWLEEFLQPWFTREASSGARPEATVTLTCDAERTARLLEAAGSGEQRLLADVFVLDSRVVRHPVWLDNLDELRIFDQELRVFYTVSRRHVHVEILYSDDRVGARVALMRVVRELAMQHAAGGARLLLHAAAVGIDGRAVVVPGPKQAGKTTLLLHLLKARGARFIANDRVFVDPAASAQQVTGLPSIISLREGTLALLPGLHTRAAESGYRFGHTIDESRMAPVRQRSPHVDLTPAQFCDLAGVAGLASASLGVLLFPSVDEGHGGSDAELLSPDASARRLRENLFGAGALARRTSVFADKDKKDEWDRSDDLCDAVARRVPAFACRVGANALSDPQRADGLIDRLFGDLGF